MWSKVRTFFSQFFVRAKSYCQRHPLVITLLALIVISSIAVRFYNLRSLAMFEADQARDVTVVSRMLKSFDPVFIGPVTSVGNMYLGPFYYYFMLPGLFLTYPDPIGPVWMVTLLSVATVAVAFYVGKRMFQSDAAGLIAAFLFAANHVLIEHARFSWNPNPAPFFILILIYLLYLAWQRRKNWVWPVIGLIIGILAQLHYVFLLAAAGASVIWLIILIKNILAVRQRPTRSPSPLKSFLISTGLMVVMFLLTTIPLMLFDWKHDWLNLKALQGIAVTEDSFGLSQAQVDVDHPPLTLSSYWATLVGRTNQIIFELNSFSTSRVAVKNVFSFIFLAGLAIYLLFLWRQQRQNNFQKKYQARLRAILVCLILLLVSLFGIAFYQYSVYDHYIIFTLPMTILLITALLAWLWENKFLRLFPIVFVVAYVIVNFRQLEFQPHSRTIDQYWQISDQLAARISPDQKYNLFLISPDGDNLFTAYRYFLGSQSELLPPLPATDQDQADLIFFIDESNPVAFSSPSAEMTTNSNLTLLEEFSPLGTDLTPTVYLYQQSLP